tara:strand:- start:301 stop:528 length:228 start_codon:yes stop_codon:yes gene_type:complete
MGEVIVNTDDELDKILDELYDYARQDTMLYRNGLDKAKQAIKALKEGQVERVIVGEYFENGKKHDIVERQLKEDK